MWYAGGMVADRAPFRRSARWAVPLAVTSIVGGWIAAAVAVGPPLTVAQPEPASSGADAGGADTAASDGGIPADATVSTDAATASEGAPSSDAGTAASDPAQSDAATELEPTPADDAGGYELVETSRAAAPAQGRIPLARAARLLVRGEPVYRSHCASCHGRGGDGQGPATRYLDVDPRDFTTGVYKWRTTPSGQLPTDADLLRTVRRGVPGTRMPGWGGRLPERDMRAVVQYIQTLSPRFAEEPRPTPVPMPDRVPPLDRAARARGRQVYVLMQCWTCHGISGEGDGPAADTLVDDQGEPIEAYDFTEGEYRGGRRPIDIYRTFTTGVNGTPMPQYHEALMVGRDGFRDLSAFEEVLSERELARLREFVAQMPTTAEIWQWPREKRLAWTARRRWDLVAYMIALAQSAGRRGDLTTPPYETR